MSKSGKGWSTRGVGSIIDLIIPVLRNDDEFPPFAEFLPWSARAGQGAAQRMSMPVLLWLVAMVLGAFAGWQLWQAWRWNKAALRSAAAEESASAAAVPEIPAPEAIVQIERVADAAPQSPAAVTAVEDDADAETGFEQLLEIRRLQQQLENQQQLVASQRARIQTLQEDIARLQQALGKQGDTALISPEYGEALRLAELDFGADEIAQRCGITVAEASLVLAMARRGGG